MPEEELRALRLKEIALVPQAAMNSLNPVMRVGTQIADGILAHEPGLRRADLRARVVDALARVGLSPAIGDRYPDQLSGGQRQRAAMAIAVALNPKVIVADEPTSALDVVVQRQVMATLGRIQAGLHAAVILIGHDLGLVAQFADTIGVLYAGRLAEYGPIDQILERPRHPYTRLLLDSLPTLEGKRALVGIPGLPPALLNLPPGCPFAPRCPLAFDRCRSETPELQQVGPDWRVACHLYPQHAELPPFREGVPTDDGAVVPTPEATAPTAGGGG
jgi:peptide/nickel transport system ATP-binding protein